MNGPARLRKLSQDLEAAVLALAAPGYAGPGPAEVQRARVRILRVQQELLATAEQMLTDAAEMVREVARADLEVRSMEQAH